MIIVYGNRNAQSNENIRKKSFNLLTSQNIQVSIDSILDIIELN